MSVDVRISLPPNVRVRNVANVLAALRGCRTSIGEFGSTDVDDVHITARLPKMCTIDLPGASWCALADFFGGVVTREDDIDFRYVVADKSDDEN